ncbi:hypothetical protein [Wolbachia endosymbiont of Armadillidium arcangelii]|uniref:Uncharacterized protein n=1 Tax=Wolbachia endosymbiont of Armadillidium arcangelii TaxID=3158571 RepID=A0AAU7Q155_9RICK
MDFFFSLLSIRSLLNGHWYKCKSFADYRKELEQKSSYIVIRAEVVQYLDSSGELLKDSIKSVVHYTTFPKLKGGNSLDCEYFVQGKELISDRKPQLKDKFKGIIKLNALMAAKHKEGLSLVVPNAFFDRFSESGKKEAKRIFVNAAIEAAKEIEQDDKKYSGFCGTFVSAGKNQELNELISKSDVKSIAVNYGDLSALSRALTRGKFAETIMGEGVGYVGNGALSASGNIAVEENLTRKTLGETVLMFSGALKVLDKSVTGEKVCNLTEYAMRSKDHFSLIEHKIKDKNHLSIKCKIFNVIDQLCVLL